MLNLLRRLWKDEEGQGLVEYALIIALIAVLLIISLGNVRAAIANVFTKITTELNK